MARQTVIPGKPSMDGRFAPPRWLINTVEVVVIFLRGMAIFIFGIAPAVASLATGHWAFRPVDLITAVIVTLFGIPFLVTYMVIERWLGRKWKAARIAGSARTPTSSGAWSDRSRSLAGANLASSRGSRLGTAAGSNVSK